MAATVEPAVDVPDAQEGDLVAAVTQLLAKDVPNRGKGQGRGQGGAAVGADTAAGMRPEEGQELPVLPPRRVW